MTKLFTASWCATCVPIKRFIKENNLGVEIIDVDEHPDMVVSYGLRSVPTIVLDNGDLVSKTDNIKKVLEQMV